MLKQPHVIKGKGVRMVCNDCCWPAEKTERPQSRASSLRRLQFETHIWYLPPIYVIVPMLEARF